MSSRAEQEFRAAPVDVGRIPSEEELERLILEAHMMDTFETARDSGREPGSRLRSRGDH